MTISELLNASKIMIGSLEAECIYIGEELIWRNNKLPSNAVEIEYIESTGTQYIDLLFKPTTNKVTIQTNIAITDNSQDSTIIGTVDSETTLLRFYPLGFSNSRFYSCNFSGKWNNAYSLNSSNIPSSNSIFYNVESTIGNTVSLIVNNNTYTLSRTEGYSGEKPLYLFARNESPAGHFAKCKMKYLKIYESDILIMDLIPIRIGLIGYMYDKISKQIFENAGTGNFVLGSDKLPSEYTELEYIETSGTQWIDTGITSTSTMVSQIKFNLLSTSSSSHVYGYRKANDYESYRLFFNGSTGLMYDGPGTSSSNKRRITMNNSVSKDTVWEFELGNNYVKNLVTGNNIGSSNSKYLDGISTITLSYWEGDGSNSDVSSARWYYAKIYEDSTLILNLIPVRKDGVGYMFDMVSKTLFTNQGTGSFILGPDKLPPEYTKLEYISSTNGGNQYIDLGIKLYEELNTQYDIAIKFIISSTNSESLATMFNCQDSNNNPWPGTYIRKNNSGTDITGRYIGGSAKDNTIGQLDNIIELPVQTSPNKNVTDINNNNSTHLYGTGLFCSFSDTNNTPQRYCNGTLYYFKLFVEGQLVRDMVPCKNSNNIVGLYDLVNKVFYTSPNGALFVGGPEI